MLKIGVHDSDHLAERLGEPVSHGTTQSCYALLSLPVEEADGVAISMEPPGCFRGTVVGVVREDELPAADEIAERVCDARYQ